MPAASFSAATTLPRCRRKQRVRLGLVRTYQINSLFPHLTALESVTLAVCERRRVAAHLVAAAHRLSRRNRRGLRHSLRADARRRSATVRRANSPTASSACSRSRSLWRPSPRSCCSTSRPPACRARRARNCSPPSPACRATSRCLFIEHDMELVFRFASRVIVMVGGRVLVEGTPAEIAADARVRAVYLGKASWSAAAWLSRSLSLSDVRAGYGAGIVLDGVSFDLPERGSLAVLGTQRRRQIDADSHHHGLHPDRPRPHFLARRGHHGAGRRTAAPAPASAGWRRSARFFPR